MQPPRADSTQHLVPLDADHPGFRDTAYRHRRDEIARIAHAHHTGEPVPRADYLPAEDELWATIVAALRPLHDRLACRQIREANRAIELPADRVPQLSDVNDRLRSLSGFQMEPVAGLIEAGEFLTRLADRVFLSTQYIRHFSRPFYTPEPDVVHELVGHAASLAHPDFVRLSEGFGRATIAAFERDDFAHIDALGRLYWYTLEYGLVREGDEVKAVGAGLLSSVGELERFSTQAELREFDAATAAATPYDPTDYQPLLFVAESFDHLRDTCLAWFQSGVTPP